MFAASDSSNSRAPPAGNTSEDWFNHRRLSCVKEFEQWPLWLSGTSEMCSGGRNANLGWSLNREFTSTAVYMHNKFPSQPLFKGFWVFWRCRQGYLEVSLIRAQLPSAALAMECIIAWRHKETALKACGGFDFLDSLFLSLSYRTSIAYMALASVPLDKQSFLFEIVISQRVFSQYIQQKKKEKLKTQAQE